MKLEEHFKPFKLGICNCGCGEQIPIRNARRMLARYKHGHNPTPPPPKPKCGKDSNLYHGGRTPDKSGYILILSPNHPFRNNRNYVQEHRLVMEKHLGRYLDPIEVVHHINHDRADNRIENLLLLPNPSAHRYNHMLEKRAQIKVERRCFKCGTDTTYWRPSRNCFEWFRLDGKWHCLKCYQEYEKLRKKIFKTFNGGPDL